MGSPLQGTPAERRGDGVSPVKKEIFKDSQIAGTVLGLRDLSDEPPAPKKQDNELFSRWNLAATTHIDQAGSCFCEKFRGLPRTKRFRLQLFVFGLLLSVDQGKERSKM